MTDLVDQLLTRLWPGRDVKAEPLLGGITNANFLISLGDQQVVLRIAGEHTELLGIDRQSETAANALASSLGVAPEVLEASESEGWMVSRFLPGRPILLDEMAGDPMVSRVANTLKRLHGAGRIQAEFDPYSIIQRYHDVAHSREVDEPFDYTEDLSVLLQISRARPFRPTAFCHNDLLNGNFLYDDELRILDWEYAGMGDPFFDLANFSSNHQLPSASDVTLLTHYFDHCDDSLLAVLALMKVVSELRETMWGVVQLAVSSLDIDFAAYCHERHDHYEELLAAMDLDETLNVASTLTNFDPGLRNSLD